MTDKELSIWESQLNVIEVLTSPEFGAWLYRRDKIKKELGYKGCRNCENQIQTFRTCAWLENGGDGVLHLICPRWKKRGDNNDSYDRCI